MTCQIRQKLEGHKSQESYNVSRLSYEIQVKNENRVLTKAEIISRFVSVLSKSDQRGSTILLKD